MMSSSFIILTKIRSSFVNNSGFGDASVNARSNVIPILSKYTNSFIKFSESNTSTAILNFPTENSYVSSWLRLNNCFFINFSISLWGSVPIRFTHPMYSIKSPTP